MPIVSTKRDARAISEYLRKYFCGILTNAQIHDPCIIMLKRSLRRYWATKENSLKSICGNLHCHYDLEGDGCTEYIILPGQHWSDEEIREYIGENWLRTYSMYDCTGKVFTSDLIVRNVPAGVLIIHVKGIDI